jgi:hypothetical protein
MGEAGLAPCSESQIELTSILVLGNADAQWRAVMSNQGGWNQAQRADSDMNGE